MEDGDNLRRGNVNRDDIHRIDDDLDASWIEHWAEQGLGELESYLAKHLAFLVYLDEG